MSFLDDLLGKSIYVGGVYVLPDRKILNFVSGATVADNPSLGSTDVTVNAGSGGINQTGSLGSQSIAAGASYGFNVTVTGAVVGNQASISFDTPLPDTCWAFCQVTTTNTVRVMIFNGLGTTLTFASNYTVKVLA